MRAVLLSFHLSTTGAIPSNIVKFEAHGQIEIPFLLVSSNKYANKVALQRDTVLWLLVLYCAEKNKASTNTAAGTSDTLNPKGQKQKRCSVTHHMQQPGFAASAAPSPMPAGDQRTNGPSWCRGSADPSSMVGRRRVDAQKRTGKLLRHLAKGTSWQ